jgi:hypothetical protein
MAFQSQSGQVGLRFQTIKGTYANPGATAPNNGVFMRTRSGAMSGNRELIIPDPEIGGNRDMPDAYLGPVAFSGSFDFYARMKSLSYLLGSAPVSTNVTDYTQHVFTPVDVGPLPWVSVEEAIGDGYETFNYTDGKINSLHLEVDAAGYLMGTTEIIALTQSSGNTRTAVPAWDTSPLYVGSTVAVTYAGSPLPAKSFSMDITNNMEDDDFRLGSVFLGDLTEKRRDFTFSVDIRPNDAALWKRATYGSAVATTPQAGAVSKAAMQVTITSYELIPGANVETYKLVIDIPSAALVPFALNPSGDDVLQHTVEIRALRPNPATPIATFTAWVDLNHTINS